MQAIDTGSFMHEVIDGFFEVVNEKDINIKELTDEQVKNIISDIIENKLSFSKYDIFNSSDKFKMLTRKLKRVIFKSMKYILEGLKNSDFEVFGTEMEFKKGKEYDPIEMELEDGKRVQITGKIDRIDLAKTENGNYIRIVDYKSSVKNIDLNEVVAGLQIQLLTYLDATCKIEEMLPAGLLYFGLIDPIIKTNKRISEEEIEEEIKKKFKMQGLILADLKVVKMMDKSLDKGQSSIVPVYIDKEGEISPSRSNTVTETQFRDLQKYTTRLIKQISKEILSGNIDINPYYNIKNKKTPCDYCDYSDICNFKDGACKNNYRYIGKMEKQEVLNKIREEA